MHPLRSHLHRAIEVSGIEPLDERIHSGDGDFLDDNFLADTLHHLVVDVFEHDPRALLEEIAMDLIFAKRLHGDLKSPVRETIKSIGIDAYLIRSGVGDHERDHLAREERQHTVASG